MAEWRKLVCGAMVIVLPASLIAQDFGRAMLHSDGGTWLNGKPAPNSSALFPHDLVQTRPESTAKVDIDGSTVTIQPDTLVQFEGDELVLDHGSLQLNSARGMRVRVNCMTVVPLTQEWTRYAVIDAGGKVRVAAYENDVKIHYRTCGVPAIKGRRILGCDGTSRRASHSGRTMRRQGQACPDARRHGSGPEQPLGKGNRDRGDRRTHLLGAMPRERTRQS